MDEFYLSHIFIGCRFQMRQTSDGDDWVDLSGRLCGWNYSKNGYFYLYFYTEEDGEFIKEGGWTHFDDHFRIHPDDKDRIGRSLFAPPPPMKEVSRAELMDFEE